MSQPLKTSYQSDTCQQDNAYLQRKQRWQSRQWHSGKDGDEGEDRMTPRLHQGF